jgi:HPt (histidine-containing phosphotransfer) domain-containing protein
VNLVLFEGCRDTVALVELAASIRGTSGRVSARYTPIFVVTDRPGLSHSWPTYVDAVLTLPFSNDALISAYLGFLSNSLTELKRAARLEPCCDIDAAIDRLGGDVDLYKDLVDRFLDDTAGMRQRVESAIQARDASLLHRAAHSLKGLAASVGAVTAANALAELEEIGRIGDFGRVTQAAQRLRIEMEHTADELADYHAHGSAMPAAHREG